MAVTLNASTSSGFIQTADTSGSLVLQSNGTTELTVLSTGVTVADNLLFNSGYGSAVIGYGCRAWINFNGTGTPATRGSGNVLSITDNGTGDYTINFTTAMPDANYSVSSTGPSIANSGGAFQVAQNTATAPTASAYRINVQSTSGTMNDNAFVQLAFFR